MLPRFDVFVENYGPGVVEKLDLGYDALRAVHPQLIYARLKGFGTTGPYANYKCMDMVAQAAGGSFSVTGYPDTPPTRPGFTVGDAGTGVQLALAITAAYVQKLRTGEGQEIEISMQEALTYYMRTSIAVRGDSGQGVAPRMGNRGDPPTDLYPCKPFGPNDYVYIMVVTERMWRTLCTLIGRPDLPEDPRFATREARIDHGPELYAEIEAWTREHTKYEAMHALAEGLPAGAVLDTRDLFEDPHLAARGFVHEVEHPTEGKVRLLGWPPRLSRSDVPIQPAPLLGQHTAEVLQSELGLSEAEVHSLLSSGVAAMTETAAAGGAPSER
jgi:formyl-CoA transferase